MLWRQDRYRLLDKEVIQPRQRERAAIESGRGADCYQRYVYAAEDFSVRRKEFWPLGKADILLNEVLLKTIAYSVSASLLDDLEKLAHKDSSAGV